MGKVVEDKVTQKDIELLYECVRIAHEGMLEGNHPFGALLADENGNILIRSKNGFKEGGSAAHAETLTLLQAGKLYDPAFLSKCTLYTNFEPCVMCAGALYWTNVGRLVYGASEKQLLALTGDNEENPTFSLTCREVFQAGQKEVHVTGPVEDEELIEAILKDHRDFWK